VKEQMPMTASSLTPGDPLASVWPGRTAWRLGRHGRALGTWLGCLLPVALGVYAAPRWLAAWAAAPVSVLLASLVLASWIVCAPFLAAADAQRLVARRRAAASAPTVAGRLAANRVAVLGSGAVLCFALAALLAPLLAPYDPSQIGDLGRASFRPPCSTHWLGTDQFGRDVLSRLLFGARISLAIAVLAATLAVALGTLVGLLAGYRGGRVDGVLMRGVDLLLAFPRLFLVLLVAALVHPSAGLTIVVLGLTGWMSTARLVRAQVRSVRHGTFVEAARALGLPDWRIVRQHVLPQVTAPVLVSATIMLGQTILAESALSFLGLGVQVPTPSWGQMVDEGRRVFPAVWWVSLFPGLAITATVVGYNMLGDALRDELDPRWRQRGRGWIP
jgi:peptide/nickel transport system permease protein